MASAPFISVIVTTYNWPDALQAVLNSLHAQDTSDFEVIIADDGSGAATRTVIGSFQTTFPVPLRHVWRPNEGPRPGKIRNRAIEAAQGEYIVVIDGDCLVLPDFVRTHRNLAEPGWFVAGKRSWLRPAITRRILASPDQLPQGGRLRWFARSLTNQCTRPFDFLPLSCDRYRRAEDWRQVQTCNMAFWRSDCVAVRGFDERYLGVGLEDSDLAVRLIRKGIRRKLGDHASIVLHLHHERRERPAESRNNEMFEELLASDRFAAIIGLQQTGL
jgi:glycosyltransferase involved in cell wall biosynthesis